MKVLKDAKNSALTNRNRTCRTFPLLVIQFTTQCWSNRVNSSSAAFLSRTHPWKFSQNSDYSLRRSGAGFPGNGTWAHRDTQVGEGQAALTNPGWRTRRSNFCCQGSARTAAVQTGATWSRCFWPVPHSFGAHTRQRSARLGEGNVGSWWNN